MRGQGKTGVVKGLCRQGNVGAPPLRGVSKKVAERQEMRDESKREVGRGGRKTEVGNVYGGGQRKGGGPEVFITGVPRQRRLSDPGTHQLKKEKAAGR